MTRLPLPRSLVAPYSIDVTSNMANLTRPCITSLPVSHVLHLRLAHLSIAPDPSKTPPPPTTTTAAATFPSCSSCFLLLHAPPQKVTCNFLVNYSFFFEPFEFYSCGAVGMCTRSCTAHLPGIGKGTPPTGGGTSGGKAEEAVGSGGGIQTRLKRPLSMSLPSHLSKVPSMAGAAKSPPVRGVNSRATGGRVGDGRVSPSPFTGPPTSGHH